MSEQLYDYAIIGAGIAGASLAAELAPHSSVLVLEAEDRPGYHATGRSAAFWEQCYGGPEIVPLTLASGDFLRDNGFLTERGALYIGRECDAPKFEDFFRRFSGSDAVFEQINGDELSRRIPGIRSAWSKAIWQPSCADIDVSGLHAHYLAAGRRAGMNLETRSEVVSARRVDDCWSVKTKNGTRYRAAKLINAAGAWADGLAQMASCEPIGITPLRRTVAQIRTVPTPVGTMPLVLDISGNFYFKPASGRLWLSPHDEEPSPPCDAAPEELAVARVIDRLENVVDWKIERVETKWAGLRSFAPDRLPVYGFDPENPHFFWFAGQGGYGIQTAPAAARLAAQLLLGYGRDAMTRNLDASCYDPARFHKVTPSISQHAC